MLCIIRETQIKKTMSCYRISVEKDENLEHWPYWMLARMWNNGQSRLLLVVVVIQSLSRVWLFVTPWSAARQAPLSITNSPSLLKLMSIESVMPSDHLILCRPLLLLPSISPSIKVFSNESSHQMAKVLELQLQHQSFWWIFRVDLLNRRWTRLISLLSEGLSRIFSSTIWKHQLFIVFSCPFEMYSNLFFLITYLFGSAGINFNILLQL